MRNLFSALLATASLAFATPFPAHASNDAEATATRLLDHLDAKQYTQAESLFTTEMATAVPAEKLKQIWESLPQQVGAAQARGKAVVTAQSGMQVVVVPLPFEKAALIAQVAINAEGKVAGFMIQPAPPAPAAAPAADARFRESESAVGNLPGTLAMPTSTTGNVPAVVLVHGSGPQDRDETVGPNRPFLDIARGLADNGIAVLRYEKRTKARPQDFASGHYTMDEETTHDAVAAVTALRTTPGIDPNRIYVLGHSQGGMLAPRIAQQSGNVAGLILLAAPARSLLTILPEQNHYLLNADGNISELEQQFLDDLQRKIDAVRSDAVIADKDTPLGLPAHYWRTFDKINPVTDARALALPMLFLQGGRDFQVIDTDWQLWRSAFADAPRATFKHYPALNHLGIAGEGPGSLDEYQKPGKVDAQLIADVSAWIKEH